MVGLRVRFALATLILLLFMAPIAKAKAQAPSQATVRSWLMSEYKVQFHAKSQRIVMRDGEIAYLTPVTLTEAGRNFSNAIVLARPKEKSAQLIEAENATLGAIHNADGKGISLVEVVSSGSGQGTTASGKSLVLFDGARLVNLHVAEEGDNLGSCGQEVFQRDCYSTQVQWKLGQLDQDGFRVLIETAISSKGAEPNAMSTMTVVTRYRLKNWKFVAIETKAMEPCTADQKAVLETALHKSAFVPEKIRVSIGSDECRQIENGKTLAIAVFFPLKPALLDENVSIEDRYDRDFKFFAGLFDLKQRRFVASHSKLFPSSGWIEIFGHDVRVHPIFYGTGKNAAFAISHGTGRSANAADFHVSEELTILMRSGTSLLPVLHSVPLRSTIALTQGGGRCCAHVVLGVTRELIPTAHQTRGMPDLEIRAERELVVDESRGPAPEDLAKAPKTYSYTVQFDGKAYQAVNSKVADPWDDLDR